MWQESSEKKVVLRTGLTTGSCATACCVSGAHYLFAGVSSKFAEITLPKGKSVKLDITDCQEVANGVRVSTVKDAGDDPDVTHGATVFVELELTSVGGVEFKAASGVGTVTRKGLVLEIGSPAINPVPRAMMTQHLEAIARKYSYTGGFKVSVGIENGEQIAKKTMNGRLGIVGGLSILGTTGIVRPFSCSAWIASIHQGIDVANANDITHIAATTGNTSEDAIRKHYDLSDMSLIEMGDFAGAVLKHLRKVPIARLSICGGFGKISKLAKGHMDLNSRASSIDFEWLAQVTGSLGGSTTLCENVRNANTSIEALELCKHEQIDLAATLCELARDVAKKVAPDNVDIEVIATDRQGNFVGRSYPEFK